jgi:hypothetical protein
LKVVERTRTEPPAGVMHQAVSSLHRELRAVLAGDEAGNIGRAIAQIATGDGWLEARSSAVLVDAIAAWLGRDAVATVAFVDGGIGPVELVARVGDHFITARDIQNEQDLTVSCCERHRARFSQAKVDAYDLATKNSRFSWGTPLSQKASNRLAEILRDGIDPEVARVVLGVL